VSAITPNEVEDIRSGCGESVRPNAFPSLVVIAGACTVKIHLPPVTRMTGGKEGLWVPTA
jgi:hypothetical protein